MVNGIANCSCISRVWSWRQVKLIDSWKELHDNHSTTTVIATRVRERCDLAFCADRATLSRTQPITEAWITQLLLTKWHRRSRTVQANQDNNILVQCSCQSTSEKQCSHSFDNHSFNQIICTTELKYWMKYYVMKLHASSNNQKSLLFSEEQRSWSHLLVLLSEESLGGLARVLPHLLWPGGVEVWCHILAEVKSLVWIVAVENVIDDALQVKVLHHQALLTSESNDSSLEFNQMGKTHQSKTLHSTQKGDLNVMSFTVNAMHKLSWSWILDLDAEIIAGSQVLDLSFWWLFKFIIFFWILTFLCMEGAGAGVSSFSNFVTQSHWQPFTS